MSTPEYIEGICELSEKRLLQFFPKSTSATESKLAMKIQKLANKIAQLEALVKENTNTMIKGFDQLSSFMDEL